MKNLYIAEKPSVAHEFAKALGINASRGGGYIESGDSIITWCYGHLVTMSYPESYDPALKRWTMQTLPFLPEDFKYELIDSAKDQFKIVSQLLLRKDVGTIYVCTDSGREGEYIYRLVAMYAGVSGKDERRVWIDSQTAEEILKGIKNAKKLSAYDNLSDSAYLRAIEDYLMGINFSRLVTLKFGGKLKQHLKVEKTVIALGRVMTCVLGMVVNREREIRDFITTVFYKVLGDFMFGGSLLNASFIVNEKSEYYNFLELYKDIGFLKEETAKAFIKKLKEVPLERIKIASVSQKGEKANAPLLYNLAELQNDCSRMLKISPDQTLKKVQELYEKKLVTYPRTDARVLSSAIAKEIENNISGLAKYSLAKEFAEEILEQKKHKNIVKSRYVNDSQITDHYAIIPTGQGFSALSSLQADSVKIYDMIVRRFLSIFYPPALYQKISIIINVPTDKEFIETFNLSEKALKDEGYLRVAGRPKQNKEDDDKDLSAILGLKKGMMPTQAAFSIKEGETTPPKRYTSGTLILAMENAGKLIEDEALRGQIKNIGIGTSATRAEILNKLVNIKYLALNKKTQIVTPTLLGEMSRDIVDGSIKALLDPALTASWEKGLSQVADGVISREEYNKKLYDYIKRRVNFVKEMKSDAFVDESYAKFAQFYS